MTQPQRIPDYLEHIVVACNRVCLYLEGKTEVQWQSDLMLQDAVLRVVQIVGEAAVRVRTEDADFMKQHGLLEVTHAIGMRNRLAHEYEVVDAEIAWDTVTTSIPALREKVIELLYELGHRPDIDSLHF